MGSGYSPHVQTKLHRHIMIHRAPLKLVLLLLAFSVTSLAQTSRPANVVTAAQLYLREHYTKYEFNIPMRDGVKLLTAVYAPKDDSRRHPILLTRTPYSVGPYGVDRYPEPRGPLQQYAKENFIFALQDVRGRNGSE